MIDALQGTGPLGIVYRALVATPRARVGELSDRLELSVDEIRYHLARLGDLGLVTADGLTWEATPPELALVQWQADHERVRARLEHSARALQTAYRHARSDRSVGDDAGILYDTEAIHRQWFALQRESEQEVLVLECPPYLTGNPAHRPILDEQIDLMAERVAAGVTYRTIYERSVLDDELYSALIVDNLALGEQVCTLAEVPVKLAIGDRRIAMLGLPAEHEGAAGGVIVLRSPLLVGALALLVDALWALAVPVTAAGQDDRPLDQIERDIVSLMAVGATDDLIARRLGISRRTVVRRVAGILARLGAANRFQAGLQAGRRGWL